MVHLWITQCVFSFEFQNSLNMMNYYCVFSHDHSHKSRGFSFKLMHHQTCSTPSKSFELYFKLLFIWFIRIMEKYSFSIYICMEILNQLKSIWILKFPFDVIEVCLCYITGQIVSMSRETFKSKTNRLFLPDIPEVWFPIKPTAKLNEKYLFNFKVWTQLWR